MEQDWEPGEEVRIVLGTCILLAVLLVDLCLGAAVLSLGWTLAVREVFPNEANAGTLGPLGFWPAFLLYTLLRRPWLKLLPDLGDVPEVSVTLNEREGRES